MGNISREWILYFNRKLQVKFKVGVSSFKDILISNMYSPRPLSLNRKEGTTGDSFQREITIAGLSQWKIFRRSWTQWERGENLGLISTGNFKFRSVILCKTFISLNGKEGTTRDSFQWEIAIAGLSQWKKCRRSWTQQERWDNQGLISIGNNRFTIPGLSQWKNIRRSWTQWERMGNQGFISMGNYKFRSIKLEHQQNSDFDWDAWRCLTRVQGAFKQRF